MALTIDDKPWWVGLIVGLVLAVAAVWAIDYTLVKSIKEEIAGADRQIEELDKKIQQGRAAERKLPQFREEVKRLELELEKLRRILPSTRNTEERSEERRVGKECRSRWWQCHEKKKKKEEQ